jgi:biopolymer transport protein ExbD
LRPQPAPASVARSEPSAAIVVQVDRDQSLSINSTPVEASLLALRLKEIFKSRATSLVFVKADGDLEFQHVARTIDTIKGAGIERVGLLGKAL